MATLAAYLHDAGKEPESYATVAQLLDQYMPLAKWDLSTREGFEGYVRRTKSSTATAMPRRTNAQ